MLRQKLLEYEPKVTCDYSLNYFAYADINSNLKIRLKKLIKNRAVFSFINKTELAGLNEHFEYHSKSGEAENTPTGKMSKV